MAICNDKAGEGKTCLPFWVVESSLSTLPSCSCSPSIFGRCPFLFCQLLFVIFCVSSTEPLAFLSLLQAAISFYTATSNPLTGIITLNPHRRHHQLRHVSNLYTPHPLPPLPSPGGDQE